MKTKFNLIHEVDRQGQFFSLATELPPQGLVSFINLFSLDRMLRHPDLWKMDRWGVDGFLLVWLFHILGIKCQRVSFDMTSLAGELFAQWNEQGQSIAIVSSLPQHLHIAQGRFLEHYPHLNFVFTSGGHFANDVERNTCIQQIVELNPQILIVGMGAVLQERFLLDCQAAGWQGLGFSCGGFIHQTAKALNYYPQWADRNNLRWLYRIWDEPKLLSRYFIDYPISIFKLFLFYIIWRLK